MSTALARATGRTVSGAISGVGQRVRDDGDAVVSRMPFRQRPPETGG